jgi:hypothetical protein
MTQENTLLFIFNNNYFEIRYLPIVFVNETLIRLYAVFSQITEISIFDIRYIIYNTKIVDNVKTKFTDFIDAYERINRIEVLLYDKNIPNYYYDNTINSRFLAYFDRTGGLDLFFRINNEHTTFENVKIFLTLEDFKKKVLFLKLNDEVDEECDELRNNKCCICYEDYKECNEIALLPCTHLLHKKCSYKYFLEQSTKCPYCNNDLRN